MSSEARQIVEIINELGMHARAASCFVQLATKFTSEVSLVRGTEKVNGKSIMGVLMLAAGIGSKVEIIAVGDDAEAALAALVELVKNRFGEEK